MMFEKILFNVSKYISLSDEEKNIFTGVLEHRKVRKRIVLLREGEVCQFEGFINKGCARIYYIEADGQEVILSEIVTI